MNQEQAEGCLGFLSKMDTLQKENAELRRRLEIIWHEIDAGSGGYVNDWIISYYPDAAHWFKDKKVNLEEPKG